MISNEKSIRICFVSAGLAGGGMERSLTNIANYAAEQGHEVTILNLFKTDVFFDLHPDIQLIWPEIDRKKMHRMMYAIQLLPYIRTSIREIKPDTILSFGEWFNAYVIIATRFLGIPVFVSDRMGPNMNLGRLLENARSLTYRFANGIIAQTNIAAQIIRKKTKAKNIIIIPNGLNPFVEQKLSGNQKIVTVGRLSKEKGHIFLIKAFQKVTNKNWTLHIVGDGPERNKLIALVQECGLTDKVCFYGHLKNFNHILATSDIFVLPSLYEGFPNALLEAMSVPLACISNDCIAGPSDVIVNMKNGILVKTENVGALTDAINLLIENEDLRNSLAANAIAVREKFDNRLISKKYLEFICDTNIKETSK